MLQKEAFYFDDLKDLSVADTFDKLSASAEGLTREEASLNAKVLRDGTWQVVPSRELVPGGHRQSACEACRVIFHR